MGISVLLPGAAQGETAYWAKQAAVQAFGGVFSSRLVSAVREQRLGYAISATAKTYGSLAISTSAVRCRLMMILPPFLRL